MKLKYFFVALLGLSVTVVTITDPQVLSNATGSPGGRTGAPSDFTGPCMPCHAASLADVTFNDTIISSNIPADGWRGGQTYTISANVHHFTSNKMGFEMTCDNSGGSAVGKFISTDGKTQVFNGGKSITHTFSGTSAIGGNKTWTFDWTAPAAGTGKVTFYGAFNATNSNSQADAGDTVYADTMNVVESPASGIAVQQMQFNPLKIYPNPAKDVIYLNLKMTDEVGAVSVYNVSGKVVLKRSMAENTRSVDVSSLNTGIYFVKLKVNNVWRLQRFIKQ